MWTAFQCQPLVRDPSKKNGLLIPKTKKAKTIKSSGLVRYERLPMRHDQE
jgi:hypothetical protein